MIRRLLLAGLVGVLCTASVMPRGGGTTGFTPPPGGLPALQAINSGSTQTNVPFSIGVPLDISMLDSSHHITASDSTNGALTCDETNRTSDIGGRNSGTPQVRMTTLSCNLPSWPNGADNITLAIASGAPGSGTDISTSDLTTANFDLTATVVTQAGTTETAQISTAFSNVGFVNITTPAVLGKWRGGGGVDTGYIVFAPYKNGGTADPNGLYGLFDVECYKAHTSAVNVSTNPILGCHVDLLNGNGVAELASPLGQSYNLLAYGISFAGGSGGATSCTNWASSAPTQTLTFSNISYTATITAPLGGITLTGDTHSGNNVIDNLSADPTSLGLPGTFIQNVAGDLPANTGVISVTSTTITLSQNATASHASNRLIDPATVTWTSPGGGITLADQQPFFLTNSGGALPSPLAAGTVYSERFKGGSETTLIAPVVNGVPINTTTAGSGTHTIWPTTLGAVVASAPLWTSDSVGTVISDGTFYATISNVQDSTHADVNVWRPLPGLSTLSSGGYHLLPINHPYGSRVHFTCDWTNTGTAAPLRVQNGNLYLGNAWNNGTLTGGPGPYFASSHAVLNYNIIADPGLSAIDNNCLPSGNISCSGGGANQGHNPSAYGSPAGPLAGSTTCTGSFNGNFTSDQQSSGGRGDIYMNPAWNVQGLFKWDQYGYQWMFQNVDHFAVGPWNVISNATGAYPNSSSSTYSWKYAGNYTLMTSGVASFPGNVAGFQNGCWFTWPNPAHAVNQFTIPYQLTGDWYVLVHELNNAFGLAGQWAVAGGTGLDNQWLGAHGAGNEERSVAWAFMHQGILVLLIPDSDTSTSTDAFKVLGGLTKPDAETWLDAQWTSTGGGAKNYNCAQSPSFFECPGTIYSPGVNASCPAGGTCNPGFTNVSTPDARYLADNPGPGIGFMNGYFQNAFGEVYELGMCDANCAQTYLWYMQGQSYVTDTTVIGSPTVVGTAEGMQSIQTSGFPCTWLGTGSTAPTWACIYSASQVTTNLSVQQAATRYPSGTATLSGTSGTITVTMPASNLLSNGGTSFYTGGFFFTYDNGFCRISTVTSSNTFTCVVVNTYGTTSYSNTSMGSWSGFPNATAQWTIPSPYGGDAEGLEVAYLKTNGYPGAGGTHYANMQQAGCAEATVNIGYPLLSTCNTINTFADPDGFGNPTQADPWSFNIKMR